jgi:hypothetical protein
MMTSKPVSIEFHSSKKRTLEGVTKFENVYYVPAKSHLVSEINPVLFLISKPTKTLAFTAESLYPTIRNTGR